MFAGHLGVGLAIARAERRVPAGAFVLAAVLLDVVLWIAVLLGVESVSIPADFSATHQPHFTFPYSHGLVSTLLWSVLAALAAREGRPLVAGAVVSHWLLDALVHRPELPVVREGAVKVGLALWDHMPLALAVESALVLGGLGIFLRGAPVPRARRIAAIAVVLITLGFTIAGMTVAPPPPSPAAMAGASLVTLLGVCAMLGWLLRYHPADSSGGRS